MGECGRKNRTRNLATQILNSPDGRVVRAVNLGLIPSRVKSITDRQTEQYILSIINQIDIASPMGDCEGAIYRPSGIERLSLEL